MSLTLATWPAMGERENEGINGEVCGVLEKVGRSLDFWNFWKIEFLLDCEGRKELKEKGKREKDL